MSILREEKMISMLKSEYDDLLKTKENYEILLLIIAEKGLQGEFLERINEERITRKLEAT